MNKGKYFDHLATQNSRSCTRRLICAQPVLGGYKYLRMFVNLSKELLLLRANSLGDSDLGSFNCHFQWPCFSQSGQGFLGSEPLLAALCSIPGCYFRGKMIQLGFLDGKLLHLIHSNRIKHVNEFVSSIYSLAYWFYVPKANFLSRRNGFLIDYSGSLM